MAPDDDPGQRPDYKVYRSRKGFKRPDLDSLRDKLAATRKQRQPRPPRDPKEPGELKPTRERSGGRRWLKWAGLGALGWLAVSFAAFGISAQIQKSKLADTGDALGGNPLLAVIPSNILVLGSDVRGAGFASDAETESEECVEAAATGADTLNCEFGARADTIMVLRAGGGAFEKLSIPRDTFAAIPGHASQLINAAYRFGGAKLQVETVERFLGIDIDHVAIVDFAGFVDFIDAVGGIEVKMPQHVCNTISGAFKIDLRGTETLNGDEALALARTRSSNCAEDEPPIDDLDRVRFQQLVLEGIKNRLTDPFRAPVNFIRGPLIGWNAPKAMVSDMGALTMPQLVLAAAVGGGSGTEVLKPSGTTGAGALVVPVESCVKAVRKLTGDDPADQPLCSPAG